MVHEVYEGAVTVIDVPAGEWCPAWRDSTAHIDGVCSTLDAAGKARLEERYEAWTAQGIRVLAVASRSLESHLLYSKEVERGLTFTGFLTFRPKRRCMSSPQS